MENPNGAVGGNSQNVPTANVPRTRSTFNLGYHFFDTHRFGEYHPHFVAEGVKEDKLPIRSSHNVMSYTLKSPLLQNISLKKDYFLVPMEAILPLNWDKFFENPVRGDDVLSDVGPTVENFWSKVSTLFSSITSSLVSILTDNTQTPMIQLQAWFRWLVMCEYFYSNGSLLSSLGCHGSPYLDVVYTDQALGAQSSSFDKFFDAAVSKVIGSLTNSGNTVVPYYFQLVSGGYTYYVAEDNMPYRPGRISLRHALSLMRDDPTFSIPVIGGVTTGLANDLNGLFQDWALTPVAANVPVNLSRLWAYQLVCAHYYSNDHIDFIYSAELFRQLLGNYWWRQTGTAFTNARSFTYNGIRYNYDYTSAKIFSTFAAIASTTWTTIFTTTTSAPHLACIGYFSALLAFRRSLRYQDYFTGSRAHPLAVGSTGVSVVNNTVDVVDVTINLQRQRFLNAVNRVRHNLEGYLQGIFGGDVPAPDYHNPFFLAHTDDDVYGQETENTGAAQMSDKLAITSNLRSNGSRYMFEINCDRPCVVLGISWYDLPRVYTKSTERPFFHVDRFDYFNPFMQFIGDQPVYLQELGINPGNQLVNMKNFSYSLRHMEFKQRFNQAAGGFVENLPGFAFLALDERGDQSTINPDWIRSVPSEFDNFYVSLTGWSNGSYFHFIVDNYNDCTGSRPMAYAPSIL